MASKPPARKGAAAKKAAPKASITKASTKKVLAKKAVPAKKVPAKKAVPAKRVPAKKAVPAKRVPAKKAVPAKKVPAKKAVPAKKVPAKKVPAKPTKPAKPTRPAMEFKQAPTRFIEALSTPPRRRSGAAVTPSALERLRILLAEERERLVGQADKLFAEAESLVKDRELGDTQFDEESGEGDTISIERERDLTVSAQHRQKVDAIDAAFVRIAAGSYGYCLVCGDRIPIARLDAAPEAEMCVKCKSRGERRR